MEVLILIPKETYNTCNFLGEEGADLLTPTSLWIHNSKIKRIGKNDRCSQNIWLFDEGCKLKSLIVLMLCSVQNSVNVMLCTKFKYNKGH